MSALVEKHLAMVGASRAAEAYLEILPEFPELEAVWLVEPDPMRADRPEFQPLRRYASVTTMLSARAIPDVALVCTPPGCHSADISALLLAGVDVIVEPPLATLPLEAEDLLELAERAGRELTTATPMRLSPALCAARAAICTGGIGKLRFLEVTLGEKLDPTASWRSDPARSGGGVWMQMGPHALDAAIQLAGPVQRIRMLELQADPGAAVEEEVVVETDHGDGLIGQLRLSWRDETTHPVARCVGSSGELRVGHSQTILSCGGREGPLGAGYDPREARKALLIEHLRRRCSRNPPIDSGAEAVGWIEAAYRSLRDRSWTRLPEEA
jgi:predicted dehydrogenase